MMSPLGGIVSVNQNYATTEEREKKSNLGTFSNLKLTLF